MARQSPLLSLHDKADAFYIQYGQPDSGVKLVQSFMEVELEYAALRKGCAVLDEPFCGLIRVTGDDRAAFLNNMLTQELADLKVGRWKPSFWLNRTGRIQADLRVIETGDMTLLDLDVHCVKETIESLESFVFAEDISIDDVTEQYHRVSLIGPASKRLLSELADDDDELDLNEKGAVCAARLAGTECIVSQTDDFGSSTVSLWVQTDQLVGLYQAIMGFAHRCDDGGGDECGASDALRVTPIGWLSANIARIEAGEPMFHVDFGPENLPHETGVLNDRVSFTKGCYLGQEVVARLQSLGQPKQILAGLSIENEQLQPAGGEDVFANADAIQQNKKPIGMVTSSTISPMLGSIPICFAMVRWGHARLGTQLCIPVEGGQTLATVREHLRFWPAS